MNEYELRSILTRLALSESSIRDMQTTLAAKRQRDRTLIVPFRNPVIVGGGGAAPTNALAGGAVTQNRDWAYTGISSALRQETTLSATSTANLVAQQNSLTGPMFANYMIDKIRIYTRLNGSGDEAWYAVTDVANDPTVATWGPVVDNSAISAYLSNEQPLAFQIPVFHSCGPGFRFRRAKVRFLDDLASSTTAYWMFWLGLIKDQTPRTYWQTPEQRSNTVGFLGDTLYPVPQTGASIGKPVTDFNLPINENDLLVMAGRAVGAVAPLPEGSVLATISEPEV